MKKLYIAVYLLFIFSCVSTSQKQEINNYNKLFSKGNYLKASEFALEKKGKNKNEKSKLLESLQAGAALRYAKKYNESNEIFDECENIMKKQDEELTGEKAIKNLFSILVNEAIQEYRAREYDGIMVNTYKALNFWQQNKKDLARVEFNRALDRQRRAKDKFAKEIKKLKEEISKKQKKENEKAKKLSKKGKSIPVLNFNKNINNPEIDKILRKRYSNLYGFEVYPDFINPFTTYIAGIFFLFEKDYKKADLLLKESYGMLKDNPIVKEDFITVEKILDGKMPKKNFVWIIFENGLGPIKKEIRVDLPLFIVTNKVKYTGIALPKLKFRDKAYDYLIIENSKKKFKTIELSSMDRVVITEFKKRFKITVTKAIVSTLLKTYMQYIFQQKLGKIGGYLGGIYHYATNNADIRIWTSLPKEFQVCKIESPKSGEITVLTPDKNRIKINVPHDFNSLVYIKIPKKGAKIYYEVIDLGKWGG